MIETEIKIKVDNINGTYGKLFDLGLDCKYSFTEINSLFDTPEGLLTSKGEILRVRTKDRYRDEVLLTHKGKNTGHVHLQRIETECKVGPEIVNILKSMGYGHVFVYERHRQKFTYKSSRLGGEVCLDNIISVWNNDEEGTRRFLYNWYIEFEGFDHWIDEITSQLGFTKEQYINKSYREIFS